jgi:hypothetical protein
LNPRPPPIWVDLTKAVLYQAEPLGLVLSTKREG